MQRDPAADHLDGRSHESMLALLVSASANVALFVQHLRGTEKVSRMAETTARGRDGEDLAHKDWREQVELEYRAMMKALLVERQRPTPKRQPPARDPSLPERAL